MADAETETPKGSKMPMLVGIVLAAALGAGGFYAVYSGMLLGGGEAKHAESDDHGDGHEIEDLPPIAFVPIEPLLVSLGRTNPAQHLRFEAHLEVDPAHGEEVAQLMPRIMDVLNSYLRAVEISDLRDPAALIVLRAQMLRRIQIVTGEGRVRDLLVTKFLVS